MSDGQSQIHPQHGKKHRRQPGTEDRVKKCRPRIQRRGRTHAAPGRQGRGHDAQKELAVIPQLPDRLHAQADQRSRGLQQQHRRGSRPGQLHHQLRGAWGQLGGHGRQQHHREDPQAAARRLGHRRCDPLPRFSQHVPQSLAEGIRFLRQQLLGGGWWRWRFQLQRPDRQCQ